MQNWYLGLRSVWSVAGQFTLITALVMTVAVIAKVSGVPTITVPTFHTPVAGS